MHYIREHCLQMYMLGKTAQEKMCILGEIHAKMVKDLYENFLEKEFAN